MSDEIWYWVENGQRKGPASSEEIGRLLAGGTISGSTLIWRNGMPEWLPLEETELSGQKSGPPTLPDAAAPARPPVKAKEPFPVRTARLREDYRPQFQSILGRAWALITSDFWPFVGLCALTTLLLSFAMQLWFPILFLMYPITSGYSFYVLLRIRKQQTSIEELFIGFKKPFGQLALLNLVLSIPAVLFVVVLVIGFIAIVVSSGASDPDPALLLGSLGIWVIVFCLVLTVVQAVANFSCLLIVDCGCGWRQALSLGWEATRRHLVKHICVFILLNLITYTGMVAFYFGVFITAAFATIAMIFLYEDAFGDGQDTAE